VAGEVGRRQRLDLCLLWAPMGLIVPKLPDLGSAAEIERFYHHQDGRLKVVLFLVSVGFSFSSAFSARSWRGSGRPRGQVR
jgi:hypothetical protein